MNFKGNSNLTAIDEHLDENLDTIILNDSRNRQ